MNVAASHGEPVTELVLPPDHRLSSAGDQQHRRIGWVAERLEAQTNPVGGHRLLGHDVLLSVAAGRMVTVR